MNAATTSSSPAFTLSLAGASTTAKIAAVLCGSLFIAAAAQINVPMWPVPMTMQTFAVLLVGMLFGARLGALTLLAYLGEGLVGLPVFQSWGNIATLIAKPATAGYLVGFLVAATLAGAIFERGRITLGRSIAAVIVGEIAIYAFGLPVLAALIGWEKAVAFGLTPFIIGDSVKAALAIALASAIGRVAIGKRMI